MDELLDERHLEGLPELFMEAMSARQRGDVDRALDRLSEVLRREPRLAEPRLELGRIHLDAGRLEDAEAQTREGLAILERGGQWLETLPAAELLSLAHGQLAEVLRQRADSDEVIFGDPEVWRALLAESQRHFAQASELDPQNSHASYHGFFLGLVQEDGGEEESAALPAGRVPDAAWAEELLFEEGEGQ